MRHWITSFRLLLMGWTMTKAPPRRKSGLRQPFAQEQLAVPRRVILERAEHFIAAAGVESRRLETVGFQRRTDAAVLDGKRLRGIHEPRSVPLAAQRLGYPQEVHV